MKRAFLLTLVLINISVNALSTNPASASSMADSSKIARGVELGDVIVYGNRSNFGVQSSQMSALNLKQAQIMTAPMFFGEVDVLKTLQKLPGVQSGSEGTAGIYVRGGAYDQNYITLDGSPIYNAEHMRGYTSAINPDMVQSINFYRGAFPARYGSRLSSVVDIGIREGDFKRYHGSLTLGVLSSRIQAEGPIWKNHTSLNVAYRVSYFNLIARPVLKHYYDRPEALGPYADMDYYDITAKLVHKFNERNRITAVAYYGKDKDNESPSESSYDINTLNDNNFFWEQQSHKSGYRYSKSSRNWDNLLLSLYFTTFVRPTHRLNFNVSYSAYSYNQEMQNTANDYIIDHIRPYRTYDETNSQKSTSGVKDLAFAADGTLQPSTAHTLRYGLKVSHQWFEPIERAYKDAQVTQFRQALNYQGDTTQLKNGGYDHFDEHVDYRTSEKLSVNNFVIYAEDDYDVTSKIKLNYGLRLGLYAVTGKTYFAAEPRISARYLLTPEFSLKASYSRMTQATHRLVTNNLIAPSDVWVPITKEFPVMKSNIAAAGVNYEWQWLSLSAEAYYKTMSDVLEYRNGATYFINNQNWRDIVAQGKGRSYGFELMAEKKWGSTTGWVSYTWSKALRKFDRPGQEINGGKEFYASTDHRNNLSANLTQHFKLSRVFDINLSASWTYQTGRRGTVPYTIIYGQGLRESNQIVPVIVYGKPLFNLVEGQFVLYGHEYDVDFTSTSLAQAFHTFRSVNDFKLPDVHHLDININFTFKYKFGGTTMIDIGCYNVYNHFNCSSVYIAYDGNRTVLKGISPFPIMPSISITQKF